MEEFDFGDRQWDMILFSWVGIPPPVAPNVLKGLKPGGVIVVEGVPAWFGGDNGLLKVFPSLRVLRYEDSMAPSDFFNRTEMRVVRICAEKPIEK